MIPGAARSLASGSIGSDCGIGRNREIGSALKLFVCQDPPAILGRSNLHLLSRPCRFLRPVAKSPGEHLFQSPRFSGHRRAPSGNLWEPAGARNSKMLAQSLPNSSTPNVSSASHGPRLNLQYCMLIQTPSIGGVMRPRCPPRSCSNSVPMERCLLQL